MRAGNKRNVTREPTVLLSVIATLFVSAAAQQNAPGNTATDSFIGRWKLNVEKSSPGPTAGAITIGPDGKKYRITLDVTYPTNPSGHSSTSSTVTDMRGGGTPVTRNFNQLISEEWCVKRESADSFTVTSIFHVTDAGGSMEWRYTVSPDGGR